MAWSKIQQGLSCVPAWMLSTIRHFVCQTSKLCLLVKLETSAKMNMQKDKQRTYKVIMKGFLVTKVAVEKQNELHIPVSVCNLSHPACNPILYCQLWPVWSCHIFPRYLINCTSFGGKKKSYWIQNVFRFSLQGLSENVLILRRTQRVIIYLHRSSSKVPVILVKF